MKKSTMNFAVDAAAFLMLLALTATGLILKFVLPPGSGGLGRLEHGGRGGEHIRDLLGMTRHQWGDVHFILSLVFIALMLAHIFLHWSWVKGYVRNCIGAGRCED